MDEKIKSTPQNGPVQLTADLLPLVRWQMHSSAIDWRLVSNTSCQSTGWHSLLLYGLEDLPVTQPTLSKHSIRGHSAEYKPPPQCYYQQTTGALTPTVTLNPNHPKFNHFFIGPQSTYSTNFIEINQQLFKVMLLTYKPINIQTDRQTNTGLNITPPICGGDNNIIYN